MVVSPAWNQQVKPVGITPAWPQVRPVAINKLGWPGQWNGGKGASLAWGAQPATLKRAVPAAFADGQGKSKALRLTAVPLSGSIGNQTRPIAPAGSIGTQMRQAAPASSPGKIAPAAAGSPGKAVPNLQSGKSASSTAGVGKATAVSNNTVYRVFDKDGLEEVAVRTLLGEFFQRPEESHGRKVYQKVWQPDDDQINVLLYYWDDRDGDAFEGWWFGNELGGTKVWAHCKSSTMEPPGQGWKIPWDGEVRPGLCIQRIQENADFKKTQRQVPRGPGVWAAWTSPKLEEQGAEDPQQTALSKQFEELSAEVMEKESDAQEVLEQARAMAPADVEAEAVATASESLSYIAEAARLIVPKVTMIADLGRKVSVFTRTASEEHASALEEMSQRLQAAHQALNGELKRVHELHVKVTEQLRVKEVEERDNAKFAGILAEATEKSHAAEDLVQTAAIVAEMISENAEDHEQVRICLAQTETAVKKASTAICKARIHLSSKLGVVKKFTDRIREDATWHLSRQQLQLKEALEKLTPLKTVRRDCEQKLKAQQVLEKVSAKVALAEVDMDKAEELIIKLDGGEAADQDALLLAKEAHREAQEHVGRAFKEVETQRSSSTGLVLEALQQMTPRAEEAKARLKRLDDMVKEATVKSKTSGVVAEASEKVAAMTAALMKLDELEGRLETDGDASLQDILALVAEADNVAAGTQSSTSMARMFIQMKALEVKRLTGSAGQQAKEQLSQFTREIEAASKRLADLKASVVRKKRQALLNASKSQVDSIEEHLERVKEAASVLVDDGQLMHLSADEIRDASEKAVVDERETADMISEARKVLMARQIDAKGKDASPEVSAELLKLQSRLSAASAELGKQRKISGSIEEKLSAKRLLSEMEDKLKTMEDKVAKAADAMSNVGAQPAQGSHNEKPSKDSETSFADATLAVRNMRRYLDSQMRTQQGSARATLCRLEERVKEAQEHLDGSTLAMRENAEKQNVRNVLSECRAKVAECEATLEKAADAERAALDGEEIHDFDKAVQAAHHAATNARVLLKMKCLAVKRLSETAAKSTQESLLELQSTVDEVSKKLVEMRARYSEWKKGQRSGGLG